MNALTSLIKSEMAPALGVTEPGAIAFAAAKARSYIEGEVESVEVSMNSGMYKNAFTCGIPNSAKVGAVYSAALGAVAGNADLGLESLANITPEDNALAEEMVKDDKVHVSLSGITSRIFICAKVSDKNHTAVVTIQDSHTNIIKIELDDRILFEAKAQDNSEEAEEQAEIHNYTLAQLYEYVNTVPVEEISFINEAFRVNMELFEEGRTSPRTTFLPSLLKSNGGKIISDDSLKTAQLLCSGGIEARVIGLNKPAMSITGSGAHGVIATMPLYAEAKVKGYSDEKLLRATALSYLICIFIKEYSGRLSAFCGCGVAAGTGMACALAYMRGGDVEVITRVINNMAASITGMICDGGNQGCTMKSVAATDVAFRSVDFAMNGVSIENVHGVCASTPEQTMHNMGLIAAPGMIGTEKTIIDILSQK